MNAKYGVIGNLESRETTLEEQRQEQDYNLAEFSMGLVVVVIVAVLAAVTILGGIWICHH